MTIFDDYAVREQSIWEPFSTSFRFSDEQVQERVVLFGLFSGTYLNNMAYLEFIDSFELALIVDQYNQNMAELAADEQKLVIDLAAQRYVNQINRQILQGVLAVERTKIAAESDEWSAKISALSSDYAALETLQTRLLAKQKIISARITELQAAITMEGIDYQFTAAEVEEKEIAVEKANVQLTLKEAQESRKNAEITNLETDSIRKDVELANKELEISEAELRVLQIQLNESETELQIVNTDLDVSRIQLQVVGAGIKSLQYQKEAADVKIRNAGIEADIARTAHIQVDLANAQIENTNAEISNAEKDLRIAQIKEETTRTNLRTKQASIDFLDVDRQAANAKIDKAHIEEKIAQTDVLEAEADAENARYNGELASLALYDSKIRIIESETDLLETKTENASTELNNIETLHEVETSVNNARQQERIDEETFSYNMRKADYNERVDSAEDDLTLTQESRTLLESVKDAEIETINAREDAQEKEYEANLKHLERILGAQLVTTLSHSISAE
jgi:hypothetical protein